MYNPATGLLSDENTLMLGPPQGSDAGSLWGFTAREDPISERKFVTILRADVARSTDLVASLDPEEALSRLKPALTTMRAAVHQFGGVISREMGDGLVAVFGAPVADDNHAPLACHAALELVRRVAALGDPQLQVRVGLHSGLAVMYVVSSEFSKVYEIGGPASHLAARLGGRRRARSDLRVRALPEAVRGPYPLRGSRAQGPEGLRRPHGGVSRRGRGRSFEVAGAQDAQRVALRRSRARHGSVAARSTGHPCGSPHGLPERRSGHREVTPGA
ncbi:hypothetical protein BH10PSE6_BH10PSE6_03800 [soil metagenome]